MPAIADLVKERDELLTQLNDDNLDDEATDKAIARASEVKTEIEAHNARVAKAQEARDGITNANPTQVVTPTGTPEAADDAHLPKGHMTAAQAMQRIATDRGFRRVVAGGGHGSAGVQLDEEATRALFGHIMQRTLISDPTTVVQKTPTPGIVPPLMRPLRIADLFDRQSTNAGALTYVRDTSTAYYGAAAAVSPGQAKPEATYTFEVVSVAFSKIAHILPVVMEALEDNAMLQGYLTGQMAYGLEYHVDSQLLNGTGVAPELEGVLNLGTVDSDPENEEPVISIRHGKTKAEQANVMDPDLSVVVSPQTWQDIETAMASSSGVFLSGTAAYAGLSPRIWGMPVVVSNAIDDNTAVVGAFKSATIWDRMTSTVSISDSNQDYFEKNILTLRAELRLALQVPRPTAFTIIQLERVGTS